jgi:hypothetical protein
MFPYLYSIYISFHGQGNSDGTPSIDYILPFDPELDGHELGSVGLIIKKHSP